MTGVIDEETCPKCGNAHAYMEFQTRTFEESLFCMKCGYQAWTRTLIDRKRSAADPEGRKFFKLRKDGGRIQRSFERKGHGTCCLRLPTGVATLFNFDKPLPPAQQQEITVAIQAGRWGEQEIDPNRSYLTVWDDRASKVRLVASPLPRGGQRLAGVGGGCGPYPWLNPPPAPPLTAAMWRSRIGQVAQQPQASPGGRDGHGTGIL